MMELMEPETFMLYPHSTELQNPEEWKDDIQNFFFATKQGSLERLKNVSLSGHVGNLLITGKHDFLPKGRCSECLGEHIFCAIWAAKTNWDILSLP